MKVSDIYQSATVKPGIKLRNISNGHDFLLVITGPNKFNLVDLTFNEVWSWDGFPCNDVRNISKQELVGAFNIYNDWKTLDLKPIESLFAKNSYNIRAGQKFKAFGNDYTLILCSVKPLQLVMANIKYSSIYNHPQIVNNYNDVSKEEFMALTSSTTERDLEKWEVVS